MSITPQITAMLAELKTASEEASKLSFATSIATIKAKQEADAMKNIR